MLSLGEIQQEMRSLNEWALETNLIAKVFTFETFKESLDFVNSVGEIAERLNHHPDIMINYKNVRLSLTTHSDGGLSKKDFEVARSVDNLELVEGKEEEASEIAIGDLVRRIMNLSHSDIDELWFMCGWRDENRGHNKSLPNWRISEMKEDEVVTKKVIGDLVGEVPGKEGDVRKDLMRNLKEVEGRK